MNTLQNLIDNGIEINTAIRMLSEYQKRIGTDNGIYYIKDINYDFNQRGRDVTLECTKCGRVIHRMMISGRNKWSELIKTCDCQKIEKENEKIRVLKNSEKIKKALILSRIGQVFGDYKIDSVEDLEDIPKYTMQCTECGAEKIVSAQNFDQRKNFHCTKHYVQPVKFDESYIGRKNNFLAVRDIAKLPNGHRVFVCECDCGNVKLIEPTQWEQGLVKSCGCLAESLKLEHSEELDRLRRIYGGMIQRCYNKNSIAYENYGGRGIIICQDWLNDREKFISWALSNGYDNDLSIDRIDVNGNYEPSNCRWATDEVQLANRRPRSEWKKPKKRKLKTCTIGGVTKPITEWYKIFNTSEPAVRYRMKILGMTLEQAIKTPKKANGRPRKEA